MAAAAVLSCRRLAQIRQFSLAGLAAVLLCAPLALSQTNPYRAVDGHFKLPQGRTWGATSAIHPAPDGVRMWVAERCGGNDCASQPAVDPVLLFDGDGNLVRSFGAGLFAWPHGIDVDGQGNVWVTDARGEGRLGHQVHKFSPQGALLLSLGQAGVAGEGSDAFNGPSDVLVAADGHIFVADGHGSEGNNRIVKFAPDGAFVMAWGKTGAEAGEFRDPHALAMDATGRLFVGDRGNSRLQIFDQEGNHLETWTSFGRPSGLFIDGNGRLYSADSESNATWGGNRGWLRGIRIGSAFDGFVTEFIPDPDQRDPDTAGTTAAEGVAVDAAGNIYGAEVGPQRVRKYVRR